MNLLEVSLPSKHGPRSTHPPGRVYTHTKVQSCTAKSICSALYTYQMCMYNIDYVHTYIICSCFLVYVSIYLSIDRSIYRSIHPSIHPSVYAFIFCMYHHTSTISLSSSTTCQASHSCPGNWSHCFRPSQRSNGVVSRLALGNLSRS